MNVLMAFNKSYIEPSMVCLASLAVNTPEDIHVYIMHSELETEDKELLRKFAGELSTGATLTFSFIDVAKEYFEDHKTLKWISKETYYRLLAQKLMPQDMERFMWLDSDIVVLSDISEFYHQDFEDYLMVVTSDESLVSTYQKNLRKHYLPEDTIYFNAGILVYNLKEQRRRIDPDIYENYLKVFNEYLPFADQDVLNAVFYKQIKIMDSRIYNFMPHVYEGLSSEQRKEALKKMRVIHYNGSKGKPWLENYVYCLEYLYWKYADFVPGTEGKREALRQNHRNARRRYLNKKENKENKEK